MQIQYRRKRVWAAALIVALFLALVLADVLEQGLFPAEFPVGIRAIGFLPTLIALFLLLEIYRDTTRQIGLAILGLVVSFSMYALGMFLTPLRPGDTVIAPLVALIFLSLPMVLSWSFVIWALKSSSDDFAMEK